MPIIKTILSRSIELKKYRDSTIACKIFFFLAKFEFATSLKISCFISII